MRNKCTTNGFVCARLRVVVARGVCPVCLKGPNPRPTQTPLLYFCSACGRYGKGLTYVCGARQRIYTQKAQTPHGARTTVGHKRRTVPDRLRDHNTKTAAPPATTKGFGATTKGFGATTKGFVPLPLVRLYPDLWYGRTLGAYQR